ncbi:MAG TPA: transposase, partial [Thermomonas sp.]|uniref:transposase n=1 Tax=Thermomonas sp. TaxID=1971895 RepID=UPI002CF8EFCB
MAMNYVQFQPGLSMAQFIQQYGTEAKCYRALYRTRWPQGFRCPNDLPPVAVPAITGRARSLTHPRFLSHQPVEIPTF